MRRIQARTADGGKQALHSELGFSLLEHLIVVLIMFFMIAMGIMVCSNIRANAYESRARQNYEKAERAVRDYWLSVGWEKRGYGQLTAEFMNENNPQENWTEVEISLLRGMDRGELPPEYFSSILILRDNNMPVDEIIVATISEPGMVYSTHFKQDAAVESLQVAYSDFVNRGNDSLQARVMEASDSK
jgi:hypothetical protein